MYYFCAICMINTETLIDLNPKCRRLFEGLVSPFIEIKVCLKSCRILLCWDCNQLFSAMLKFQQTMVKGVRNLVALQKRSNMTYHNLPLVIKSHTDLLLPVVNEEYVVTTNSVFLIDQPVDAIDASKGKPKRKVTVFRLNKATNAANLPDLKKKPPYSILRKRLSETDKKTPIKRKRQRKNAKSEEQDLDSTMSCDSDCCFAGDPDNVPGYQRLVATTQMDHDYVNNTNDMAELVPINNPRDKIDCTNTNKLNVIKKTKLNRQLYQAIKFALESRPSISDFDIAQYEPESESDFDHDFESHHDLNSLHHDLKSPHHDSTSAHHNSKSPHLDSKSSHHDSKSPYLDSKSSHQDIKSPHHDSKSSYSDLKSSLHDSESSPQYEKSLHDSASPHRYSKSSHLETNSLHHDSKSPHHDSKSSSYPDSESTLTCESDYEDAENFPNIMLAKAFSGVAEGSGVSVDVQKKAHLVLNPPSEWPCTLESCFCTRQHSEDSSDCSVIQISDEDTRSNVKRGGKRSRKECKLCEKTFVSLHALWEHYESEHVDICRKGCCNGTALKYGNNRHLLKVPDVPDPQKSQYNCAECGIDCRNKTQMRLHVATLKHKLRSLWRFQCDTCKRKFLNKVQVAEHIEREHLAKEACPKCGATFHSERALRKHAAAHALAHKQAHAHANTHAHTQAQGARKRRTRKLTETEKTPISRNVLDTDTTATIALSNRRKKRKRKGTHWTRQRKQLARNTDTQTNVQRTRKRTQGTQPRKQRATDSGTHMNVHGTKEQTQGTQSRVQLAPNSDAHMNAQWIRKLTQGKQPRKQLATDFGTHTNVQGTQEQTQGTVQLAPNSDTQMQMQLVWIRKRTRGTRKRTQGKRKRTQVTQEQTQGTQSRVQLAPNSDTHTNGMQGPRKRTQTVGELRKMQMGKERTQLENERMVNFYLNKFTCFEAGGEISRALTYPPKNQGSPS